jgi:hypothetical protein
MNAGASPFADAQWSIAAIDDGHEAGGRRDSDTRCSLCDPDHRRGATYALSQQARALASETDFEKTTKRIQGRSAMSLHSSSSRALSLPAVGVLGVCAGLGLAGPALAAIKIGSAASINQSVTGALSGKEFPMSVGDEVKLRETVQTDGSGQARLILDDNTDVAILSRSTMTIERYAPGSKVVFTPDGKFIVHTGHGTPGEPRFNTPAGTLTPQGTRFWYEVRGGRLQLEVQEGAVRFCPRGKSQAYCVVATPGHKVIGSAGAPAQVLGMDEPPPPSGPPAYPPPVYHGDNHNTSPPPPNCRGYRCGTGATGWNNGGRTDGGVVYGGANDGGHSTQVMPGYPLRMAQGTGRPGWSYRGGAPGFRMRH